MNRSFALTLALWASLIAAPLVQAQRVVINEILASNSATLADPDFAGFGDWIELYNMSDADADLSGFMITDNLSKPAKWSFPDGTTVPARGFLIVWADDEDTGPPAATALHTGFKLSGSGEQVGLFDASGAPVDTLTYGEQTTDVSYGRSPDGADTWAFFSAPTPGAPNASDGVGAPLTLPTIDRATGFYAGSVTVEMQAEAGAAIRFTRDGSPPSATSPLYSSALTFGATTVLRAAAFAPDRAPSPIATRTFFVDEQSTLPVVSLVTDPAGFFSDTSGIYVRGTNGETGRCSSSPVNWNRDWEREVQFSFLEPDGNGGFDLAVDQGAGAKIFGGCSRLYPQKSLALHARSVYGASKFEHRFFADLDLAIFDDLVLRSSAQDWYRTMFRDGMIQTLTRHMDLDGQAYRPTIVFLNGAYWGIHNLREKLNEDWVVGHYGVEKADIELLDAEKEPLRGRSVHYDRLLDLLDSGSPADPAVMEQVGRMIDVDQYITYLIAEIYSANADWPGNNLKLWRSLTDGARWRWMLFDTDFGFGGNGSGLATSNTLALATATNGPSWPNPPWSTFLFRKLLENDGFRHTFIQRMAAHIGTTFEPLRVESVIDSLQANIAAEMPRHTTRWTQSASFGSSWESQVNVMRTFARDRPSRMRTFVAQQFDEVSGSVRLTVSATDGGRVFAEGVELMRAPDGTPFSEPFFRNVPLQMTARPDEGYVFAGWSGQTESSSDSISVVLSAASSLTATFARPTGSEGAVALGTSGLGAPHPNPAAGFSSFDALLARTGPLSVRVYDLLGREVAVLADGIAAAGSHRLTLDTSRLPNGAYLVVMTAGDVRAVQRVVVAQ